MISLSLILKSTEDDQQLADTINRNIIQWSVDLGSSFILAREEDEEDSTTLIWVDGNNPENEIRLVFDHVAQVRYLSAYAPDEAQRQKLFDRCCESFEAVSVDDLRREAVERWADDPGTLLRLALGLNGAFDEATVSVLRTALASGDVDARASAAETAGLLQWPQLADDLDAALARETDAGVARVLEVASKWSRLS